MVDPRQEDGHPDQEHWEQEDVHHNGERKGIPNGDDAEIQISWNVTTEEDISDIKRRSVRYGWNYPD